MTSVLQPSLRARDKRVWTKEELRSLDVVKADKSLTLQDAAELLRRTPRAILHKAKSFSGSKRTPWTPEHDAELLRWRAEGLTSQEIANRIGRTKGAVNIRLHAIKAPKREHRAPWLSSELHTVARMINDGASVETVAEYFGRSAWAVYLKVCALRKQGRITAAPDASDKRARAHIAALIARGISPETANMLRRTK